eukprot:scaffold21824_cov28-Tisochrysis_lutea.AAC.1
MSGCSVAIIPGAQPGMLWADSIPGALMTAGGCPGGARRPVCAIAGGICGAGGMAATGSLVVTGACAGAIAIGVIRWREGAPVGGSGVAVCGSAGSRLLSPCMSEGLCSWRTSPPCSVLSIPRPPRPPRSLSLSHPRQGGVPGRSGSARSL